MVILAVLAIAIPHHLTTTGARFDAVLRATGWALNRSYDPAHAGYADVHVDARGLGCRRQSTSQLTCRERVTLNPPGETWLLRIEVASRPNGRTVTHLLSATPIAPPRHGTPAATAPPTSTPTGPPPTP